MVLCFSPLAKKKIKLCKILCFGFFIVYDFKNDIGNRTSSRLIRSVITHGSRKAAHITDQNNRATVLSSLTVHKFRLNKLVRCV